MIRFIKEPPGKFRSRYTVGGTARFDKGRERILISKGYAVEISEETNQSNARGLQPDDTVVSESKVVPVIDDGGNGSGRRNNRSDKRRRTGN